MNKKKPLSTNNNSFLKSRTQALKTYVKQSLQQPISIEESKTWIANTTSAIKQLGQGHQLTWPEYAAKMDFSCAENIVKAYRNIAILFYLCMAAVLLALLEILYLIGSSLGGDKLIVMSAIGTLLSMVIGANLMIIFSKELWMIKQEKVVNIHQWLGQIRLNPWSIFPTSLDYEKALRLYQYSKGQADE